MRKALFMLAVILASGCAGTSGPLMEVDRMQITSPVFSDNGDIPPMYTCQGQDVNPPLQIDEIPAGTKSLVLIMDDPDAPGGVFTHWVLFNLPADSTGLPEGVPTTAEMENGARQGLNDFGMIGYGGPCPPSGSPHHYHFTLYALGTSLGLDPGSSKAQVLGAIAGHILAEDQLVGLYGR